MLWPMEGVEIKGRVDVEPMEGLFMAGLGAPLEIGGDCFGGPPDDAVFEDEIEVLEAESKEGRVESLEFKGRLSEPLGLESNGFPIILLEELGGILPPLDIFWEFSS